MWPKCVPQDKKKLDDKYPCARRTYTWRWYYVQKERHYWLGFGLSQIRTGARVFRNKGGNVCSPKAFSTSTLHFLSDTVKNRVNCWVA
jgi:hypothetical protein